MPLTLVHRLHSVNAEKYEQEGCSLPWSVYFWGGGHLGNEVKAVRKEDFLLFLFSAMRLGGPSPGPGLGPGPLQGKHRVLTTGPLPRTMISLIIHISLANEQIKKMWLVNMQILNHSMFFYKFKTFYNNVHSFVLWGGGYHVTMPHLVFVCFLHPKCLLTYSTSFINFETLPSGF